MTAGEVKDYALTHLPCTAAAVVTLFDLYFTGWLTLDKMIGLRPGVFGYRTLVFYVKFPPEAEAESHPMPKAEELQDHLKYWFWRQDFKVTKIEMEFSTLTRVYWVETNCEIKEDRHQKRKAHSGRGI